MNRVWTSLSVILLLACLADASYSQIAHQIAHETDARATLAAAAPLAGLCRHAYVSIANGDHPANAGTCVPKGYKIVEPRPVATQSGFLAKTYQDETTKQIYVIFAETDPASWSDLLTDFGLIANCRPPQFEEAWQYFQKVISLYPSQEVIVSGHSLGGALATYVGMRGKRHVFVFNSPGLNKPLNDEIPSEHKASFVDGPWYMNFRSSGDPNGFFRFERDLITQIAKDRLDTIFVVDLPTGCAEDRLCHSINLFESKAIKRQPSSK